MTKKIPYMPVVYSSRNVSLEPHSAPQRATEMPKGVTPPKDRLFLIGDRLGTPLGFQLHDGVLREVLDEPSSHVVTIDGFAIPTDAQLLQTVSHHPFPIEVIKECSLELQDFGKNPMEVWQRLVMAYNLQLPPWLAKEDGMVKVCKDFITLSLTHAKVSVVSLPPNDSRLFHVTAMAGFSLAKVAEDPVISTNNDPELAEKYGRQSALKKAEERLWEIYGGALYVRIADEAGSSLRAFLKKYTFDHT